MALRVGLTGGLGSGKSTVAAMLAARGAHILSADELGRELMQPGQAVFAAIAKHFGPQVVRADGTLDRPALARLAFAGGRIEELNAIVHPATIALQAKLSGEIIASDPGAVVIVESALIFESKHGDAKHPGPSSQPKPWRARFDRLVLVCAPEKAKIARFCARCGAGDPAALEAEARRRLAQMIPDGDKVALVDYVLRNDGTLEHLEHEADRLWHWLSAHNPLSPPL